MTKQEKLEKDKQTVQDYFEKLRLSNWTVTGNFNYGGQATGLEVKNTKTNQLGFFRLLKEPDEVDKKRFHRELKVLTDERFKHPNIVNIVDTPTDESQFWYISEKGKSFSEWWSQKKDNAESENEVFNLAITVVIRLADGLIKLHDAGVVHRDIKPDNLIIINQEPILIDFGIVYDPEEERITPKDASAGNAKFSPDQVMVHSEEIPSWIDVFHLGQLLLWMVAEKVAKHHWRRPLHWIYVSYPSSLSQNNAKILRTITAVTSLRVTSPQNARELVSFIQSTIQSPDKDSMNEVSKAILEGVKNVQLTEMQMLVSNVEILQVDFERIKLEEDKISHALISSIMQLAPELKREVLLNKRIHEYQPEIIRDKYTFEPSDARGQYYFPNLIVRFGEPNSFFLELGVIMQVPEFREQYQDKVPEEFINFSFRFEFSGHQFNQNNLVRFHRIFLRRQDDVVAVTYNEGHFFSGSYSNPATIGDLISYIVSQFQNSLPWRLAAR